MHLALPARKSSHPPPYAARSSRFPTLRRSRAKSLALLACALGAFLFILSCIFGGEGKESIPSGTPRVVVVTVLDKENYSKEYINNIIENRQEYAAKHGYGVFFAVVGDYELAGAPGSWTRVPATRHALSKYPQTEFFWYLDQNALIMNPLLTVEDHIMEPKRLESLMIRDHSIVPPDSVIKTFPHLKPKNVDLVLTQDRDGLAQGSFIIRRGEWAKFFLDTWFDPLYRSYNFQKADTHALEHIVQWHPTILSKLVLVPQRTMNSYNKPNTANNAETFKDGDFVVRFGGCESVDRDCMAEAEPFLKQWKTTFREQ